MRALWLDFQQEEPGRRRGGIGLLIAGLLVGGGLLAHYLTLGDEVDALQQQVAHLRHEVGRQGPPAPGPVGVAGTARLRPELASITHSAARWEALFLALESACDDSMTLVSLQPGSKEIQIAGEARNLDAALGYVTRLQAAPAIANAHLTQTEVVAENPLHPVRFSLLAEWPGGMR